MREPWASKLKGKKTRETIACKLAVMGTSGSVIREIYETYPECRRDDENLTVEECYKKDYHEIYAAIRPFNPHDKRFNKKKYGAVVQKALDEEYKHTLDQFVPAHVTTVQGLLKDIKALNSAPDNKHWNQIRARFRSIEAQALLLEHAKAIQEMLGDNALEVADPGLVDDESRRYLQSYRARQTQDEQSGDDQES